ncbi:MAG TPA: hypothetical protein VD837_13135 [Terriglobales bacterium]|nr:hypothetical protein [Terriglobales bacterium]
MTTPPVVDVAAPHLPDRRGWLIAFGILEILIAFALLGMIGLMLLGVLMAGRLPNQPPPSFRMMLQSVSIYALGCVFFVVMGIGSLQARRWARSLMVAVSWLWLLAGTVGTLIAAYIMPGVMKAAPGTPAPQGVIIVMVVVMLVFMSVALIALPLISLLFYRSAAVKATCERLDPVPRWTDRIPLPVLVLVVMLAYGSITFAVMAFSMPMIGVFGQFVSGVAGTILCLALAALWGYLSWRNSRLELSAWWGTIFAQILIAASSILTFARADASQTYAAMGLSVAQSVQSAAILKHPAFLGGMIAISLAFTVYVVCLRKYYQPAIREADSRAGM